MADNIIYLKMNDKVNLQSDVVRIGDLGKVYCGDKKLATKVKTAVIHQREGDSQRCVISVLKAIETIHQRCGWYTVDTLGEEECIVEWELPKKSCLWKDYLKVGIVSCVCFFGTMYTIMAYHTDINLTEMLRELYTMAMGKESDGFTVLEVSYSLGLSLGIIVFYNHVGKRRLTPDPTPVEVEMRTYEDDINHTLVEMANREEKTIDVS